MRKGLSPWMEAEQEALPSDYRLGQTVHLPKASAQLAGGTLLPASQTPALFLG